MLGLGFRGVGFRGVGLGFRVRVRGLGSGRLALGTYGPHAQECMTFFFFGLCTHSTTTFSPEGRLHQVRCAELCLAWRLLYLYAFV